MKYSLGDYIKTIVISLLVFSLLLIVFMILKFDYNLGVNYCNKNNIPLDFVLPVSGVPFIFGMTFTLLVFESIGVYYLGKILKRIPFIKLICKLFFNKSISKIPCSPNSSNPRDMVEPGYTILLLITSLLCIWPSPI